MYIGVCIRYIFVYILGKCVYTVWYVYVYILFDCICRVYSYFFPSNVSLSGNRFPHATNIEAWTDFRRMDS